MDKVRWVEPNFLLTEDDRARYTSARRRRDMIAVIPLADLTEVVEGLRFIAVSKDEDVVVIAQRLLAQLEEVK